MLWGGVFYPVRSYAEAPSNLGAQGFAPLGLWFHFPWHWHWKGHTVHLKVPLTGDLEKGHLHSLSRAQRTAGTQCRLPISSRLIYWELLQDYELVHFWCVVETGHCCFLTGCLGKSVTATEIVCLWAVPWPILFRSPHYVREYLGSIMLTSRGNNDKSWALGSSSSYPKFLFFSRCHISCLAESLWQFPSRTCCSQKLI